MTTPTQENRAQMTDQNPLARVIVDPKVCDGKPFIQGTCICIAIILDALEQGLSPAQIVAHYPCLETEDIQAALAFATQLAEMNGGVALIGRQYLHNLFHPL
jgi:uncharacterized protein (DUF433 family)